MPLDEIDDIEFDKLLQDKRHKELTAYLKAMATAISNNSDKEVIAAINKQGDSIGQLVNAIQSIPKPEKQETPIVNVEINPQQFVTSINKICEDIVASNNKVIEALNNRMLPDSFTLVKTYGGMTESVKVNYKESSKITIKK